ncbi:MAG: BatD family protein [Parachlamydiaceae bacterium]|nr:BatD family protein [Parachlamydiaceae bacterium]
MNMKSILFFILLGITNHLFAEIHVELNRQTIGIHETFSATYTSSQKIKNQPDFSPLNTDFDVLSTNQSHQIQFINGHMKEEIQWKLTLRAKKEGNLVLPQIQFGDEFSPSQTIQVTDSAPIQQDDSIFLETELSPKDAVYEQSPFLLTIRLYRSVNLSRASLSEVQTSDPDAMIERQGNDQEYESYHSNGKQYIVLERKYLITPQHAGELYVSPVVFEGEVLVGGFGFFNFQSEFKRVLSQQQKILVKPIPASFNKENWFPAYNVKLMEEWSIDPEHVTVGEPITRTITIIAEGSNASQIPDISFQVPQGLKSYSDKPQLTNEIKGTQTNGTKQIKTAYIGVKPEELTLPAVNLTWWDLKTDQPRVAQLPSRILRMESEPLAMNEFPVVDSQVPLVKDYIEKPVVIPFWVWIGIGLNVFWIVPLFVYLFKNLSFKRKTISPMQQVRHLLKEACDKNEAKQAEIALLSWGSLVFSEIKPMNLKNLKSRLSESMQEEVDELYKALYQHAAPWKGESLWQAFVNFQVPKKSAKKEKTTKLLKELWPQ